ncbi:MAG: HD domain-containing phosphohydrolase [Lysobacterales bacterium]
MKYRVLFVDDEPNILQAISRNLRRQVDLLTCDCPSKALKLLDERDDIAVVISDMRMPAMSGADFLAEVRKRWPDIVRVMLTGNNDQLTAVESVNKGQVFRFLSKPLNTEILSNVANAALRQHQLISAEKELLEKTLNGSVKTIADILALAKPEVFGMAGRIRDLAKQLGEEVDGIKLWQLNIAATLGQLGCITVSDFILEKIRHGHCLNAQEAEEFLSHPQYGASAVAKIPRLERVAEIIRYQHKHYDGGGWPRDDTRGTEIPLESRVLAVAAAFERYTDVGMSEDEAMKKLSNNIDTKFDPQIVSLMASMLSAQTTRETITPVEVGKIKVGMTLHQNVETNEGLLLVCKGQRVSDAVLIHLLKFKRNGGLTQPLLMKVCDLHSEAA